MAYEAAIQSALAEAKEEADRLGLLLTEIPLPKSRHFAEPPWRCFEHKEGYFPLYGLTGSASRTLGDAGRTSISVTETMITAYAKLCS